MGAKVQRFFLRVGLRKTLPLVAQKKIKLIRLIKILRIARANRAVKFSSGCLQNCGLEKSRGDRKNPLSTVGNVPSAERNAPPCLRVPASFSARTLPNCPIFGVHQPPDSKPRFPARVATLGAQRLSVLQHTCTALSEHEGGALLHQSSQFEACGWRMCWVFRLRSLPK